MNIDLEPAVAEHAQFLFHMLHRRPDYVSISHKRMPTFDEHLNFVNSHPYRVWFIIYLDDIPVGNVYITTRDEIGIHLIEGYHQIGIGTEVAKRVMAMYGERNFYFNVSPKNKGALRFVRSLGAEHIHNTYEIEK